MVMELKAVAGSRVRGERLVGKDASGMLEILYI